MSEKSTNKNVEKPAYTDPVTGKFAEGNPGGGRPKGSLSLVGLLKKKLEEVEPNSKRQYAELLIERMTKMAIAEGSESQIKNILQYVEGMPKQPVDVTSNGETIVNHYIPDTQKPSA